MTTEDAPRRSIKARSAARRERQVVEIAALIVAGARERAAGLALEHTMQFPEDADLLASLSGRARRDRRR